ncbi:MAG: DUF3107 domain-containing protein [Actinomycetota bacterium]|nr:DUF3107 domain-containing protein [Acidimicrobiales bacterium]MEC9424533.1 DUF3107 domain-containing protein [Actinomycetota bacterium]MEC9426077.1 DUF3107 domain-containing protein [Actinomycetota bacterium]MED5167511.1 DUF3107 domain-containing protein [Actinomycetota bacterium]MED5439183.1 DUF3107 domain-containing protein [Actinomycetota bacterium]
MDLRIGVTNAPKEITVELADDTDVDALRADVDRVVGGEEGAMLWLTDVRGRQVGVPADRIAYVDVGAAGSDNPVGFG